MTPEQTARKDLSKYWTFVDIVPLDQITPPFTDHVVVTGTIYYNGLIATLDYIDEAVHRSFIQHHLTDF